MENQNIELSQNVRFSEENAKLVQQEVSLSAEDNYNWISVVHAGHEITLSLDNWRELNKLVEKAVEKVAEKS